MRVVVAVDKFKGSLTGVEANEWTARGVRAAVPAAEIVMIPVADGGEGTLDAARAAGFTWNRVTCSGPTGEPVGSGFALRDGVAVVEMADACGLLRVPALEPGVGLPGMTASSRGLGEVMVAALDAGCSELVVGIGGSASTDGGAGLLQALGLRLLDETGADLGPGVTGLARVASADASRLHPALRPGPGRVRLVIASDVANPLLGESGAACVFGPQKGLTVDEVALADDRLGRLANVVEPVLGMSGARDRAGAGAAGGAGWALLALGGEARRGIDVVLEWSSAEQAMASADLVITGEGSLDEQSLAGKAPLGVAELARRHGVRVVAVSGRRLLDDQQLSAAGFAGAVALTELEPSVERCIAEAGPLLEAAAGRVVLTR